MRRTVVRLIRNVTIYGLGVAVAIGGSLMLIDVVAGSLLVGAGLFGLGLGIVLFVHERLAGPI